MAVDSSGMNRKVMVSIFGFALYGQGVYLVELQRLNGWPASLIAAVTINFGEPDDTLECVRSLRATSFPDLRIIVVDNGSPAPARTRLQDEVPPGVELILSDRNVGFSGGNNLGIRQALERGAD